MAKLLDSTPKTNNDETHKNAEQDASLNSLWRVSSVQFYDHYNLNPESKFTIP